MTRCTGWRQRWAGAGSAAIVLLVAGGCTSSGDAGGDVRPRDSQSASQSGSPSTSRGDATYLGLPVEEARSAHVVADGSAEGLMVAQARPRRLWVGGVDRLSWISPRDESVHQVDSKPGVGLFLRRGSLYRAAYFGGDVARYDVSGPDPRETARVRLAASLYVSADRNGVWVTDHDRGRLVSLDPRTLARRGTIQLGPRAGGYRHALAGMTHIGDDRLWVMSERDERLYEVDTRTGRVVDHVQLDARPTDRLVRDGHHLWVMLSRNENDERADLELVDAASRQVVTRVVTHDAAFVTAENRDLVPSPPVVVHGEVWVPSDEHLVHLDATHGWRPDRVIALPVPGMFARDATVAFGSLWIHSVLPRQLILRVPLASLD